MPRLDAESDLSSGSESEFESAQPSPGEQPNEGLSRKEQRAQDLHSVRSTYGDASARKPSALRRSANAHSSHYSGVPTTSDQLWGDYSSSDEDGESESKLKVDDAQTDLESDEEEQAGDSQDDDDEYADTMEDHSEDEDEAESSDEQDEQEGEIAGAANGEATLAAQRADEDKLAKSIAAQRKQDAERGKSVEKQRAAYEMALDMRIRAQKVSVPLQSIDTDVLALLNRPDSADELQVKAVEVASALLQVSADLFNLRTDLMARNGTALSDVTETGDKYRGKKRKHSSLSDARSALEEQVTDARTLSSAAWAQDSQILEKWSSRARSDPVASGGAEKFAPAGGFKAINQSATAQIERALHPQAIGRLRERAHTWRGPARVRLPAEEAEAQPPVPTDVFDDTDFYHTLLRELIESRAAGNATGTSSIGEAGMSLPSTSLGRDKGPKAPRDQKASKGRKLRYETHEKIVHFMPPIPRVTWGQGQTDRLFTQLAGAAKGIDLNADEKAEDPDSTSEQEPDAEQHAEEGFRLFG